jgi:flagellar assembly protein FliH
LEALRQEAYAQGRQDGLDEARERFGRAADALGRGLEEVARLRESLLSGSSHDMLRLVMTVARQVVQTEISINQELVLKTIERALQAAVQADSHRILVAPEDLALVKEKKPLFLASIHGLKNVTIEADPSVSPGGCRLESELGEVDATVESQLEEIRRTLTAAIGEG